MEDKQIREYIFKQLKELEFVRSSKGFTYLNEAIFLCIKNECSTNNLTKNVYTVIANKYKERSPKNVKGCIEQSINTMYNNTNQKLLNKYFYVSEYQKPTLKFIICMIVNKYRWNKIQEKKIT